jgi:hypothetical protein
MRDLVFAAYRYGHVHSYGYGYHHGGGWSDWIAHTVVSSIIHAMIFRVVFQLMHRLTLGDPLCSWWWSWPFWPRGDGPRIDGAGREPEPPADPGAVPTGSLSVRTGSRCLRSRPRMFAGRYR